MKKADILIYSPKITNRLQYILELYFNVILGVSYDICDDIYVFKSYKSVKLNYSKHKFSDECFIESDDLLFRNEITKIDIESILYQDIKCIFPTSNSASSMPFDPFAAAFYLITRYEEYLPFNSDEHGRFLAVESVSYKLGFLEKPVINIWAKKLRQIICQHFPQIVFPEKIFQYKPTIDIDIAYLFKNKGFYRTFGAIIKDAINLKLKILKERVNVLINKLKDPYDVYDFLYNIHQKNNLNLQYFVLLGDLSKYDRSIDFKNKKYINLLRKINKYASIGIHPSYKSHTKDGLLKTEIKRLENLLGIQIKQSRYHFLKMSLPHSYQTLIKLGIKEEFTMGYASKVGFRAGVCTPFLFFDLENNKKTSLKVFPFAVMDVTLKNYVKLKPDMAIEKIKTLIDNVKLANGTFISLWHNESLSEYGNWVNWRKVYIEMIKYATKK